MVVFVDLMLGLQLVHMICALFFPIYWMIFWFADIKLNSVSGNSKFKNAIILPIEGPYLVLQEVLNVHSHYFFDL